MNPFIGNTSTYRDAWPCDTVAAKKLDKFHKEKVTTRKLNVAEVFDKAPWHPSIRAVARKLYDVCQSGKGWARQMSQSWLAKQTGFCRMTINRALRELERLGIVKIYRRDLGQTYTYQFNIPDWLDRILSKFPSFKSCSKKQVLNELSQSNLDLTTYKKYTEFRDSSDERKRIFFKNNPEKVAMETDKNKNYTAPDQWSPAHKLFEPKEYDVAPKEVGASHLQRLKSLFKGS